MADISESLKNDEVSFSEYAKNADDTYISSVKSLEDSIKKAKKEFQYSGDAVKDIAKQNGRQVPSFMDCWKAVCAEADGKRDIRKAEFKAFFTTLSTSVSNAASKGEYLGKSAVLGVKSAASDFKNIEASDVVKTGLGLAGVAGVANYYEYMKENGDSDFSDIVDDVGSRIADVGANIVSGVSGTNEDKQEMSQDTPNVAQDDVEVNDMEYGG